jgi:heat shock protein HslJ
MKAKLAAACLLLLAGPAFGATAHRPRQPEPQKPPAWEKSFPTGANFTLTALNGKPVPRGMEATLLIDVAFRGQGTGGCNNWSATLWPVRGQRLVAGGFSVTRKACSPAAMSFERTYLSILASGATWDLVNDQLMVKSPRGTLAFKRGF